MAFGIFMRLRSYEALGPLFTFDLCIKPEHRLVTPGPYSFVRNLAYLGSLYLMAGLTFVGLTRGGWIIECAVGSDRSGAMFSTQWVWITWWVYMAGVGYARAVAEDEQMENRFGQELEGHGTRVGYWFVLGLV